MKEQHLPSVLKHRVLDFFEYLWVRNKGTDRTNLLSDLPYCMQAEVSLATTESLLKKVIHVHIVLEPSLCRVVFMKKVIHVHIVLEPSLCRVVFMPSNY